jgi:hypothetical protein
MADEAKWIVALRVRRPDEERTVEIRLSSEDVANVDAVFITVDASERILKSFYEDVERDKDKADRLQRQIDEHRVGNICLVLHKRMTSFLVPEIDWSARSPIRI